MRDFFAEAGNSVVTIENTDIHYLDVGDGPPLLLVHGLGHSIVSWHRNIEALRRRHRVIALDLPGYGLSACPADAPYDPPYYARMLRGFAQKLGLRNINGLGCSAGGLTILLSALDDPKLFDRIVLVNSVGFTKAPGRFVGDAIIGAISLWLLLPRVRPLIRALYCAGFYDPSAADEETVAEIYGRRMHGVTMEAARRAFSAFFAYSRNLNPLHQRLKELKTPVLVIWGKNDRMLPVKDTQVARELLPQSRIHWLDRCGHLPQLERPNDFNSLVLEFLKAS